MWQLLSALAAASAAYAQSSPQCNAATNGSSFDGTAGSELQLNSTTVRSIKAADAVQGVAVDADYFYSIDNYSITKHNKTTGEALLQWYGGAGGPIGTASGDMCQRGESSLTI